MPRKPAKQPDVREKTTKIARESWTTSDAESDQTVAVEAEAVIVAAAEADLEDETLIDDLRPPETVNAAMTDSASQDHAVTSIPTCRLEATAAAAPPPHPHMLFLLPRHRPLARVATSPATGLANVVPVPLIIQSPPNDATAEDTEDAAVRTTVTVLKADPFPAAVPRAHVPPEETAAVEAPFLPPVPVHRRAPAAQMDALAEAVAMDA